MASTPDFIKSLKTEMKRRRATQAEVASCAGLSQAHLSRLLSGALPLTGKSRAKLERWVSSSSEVTLDDRMRSLLQRIQLSSAERRNAIAALLGAFEAILDA